MDTGIKFSSLLSFLLVVPLLLSYSMADVSKSNFYSSTQQNSFCKKAQITSLVESQPSGVKQSKEDAVPSQGVNSISTCSMSLQVIPVKEQNLVSPGEDSFVFPPFTPATSSQAFMFQEPDPPQTI
jgi:hypothetical protein